MYREVGGAGECGVASEARIHGLSRMLADVFEAILVTVKKKNTTFRHASVEDVVAVRS